MSRFNILFLAAFLAFPGLSAAATVCEGEDLIAALPAPARAALEQRADAAPHARGNLWRAEREGRVIHLLGTYHFDDPRHAATLAHVAPLLDQADVLLVEAGPEEQAQLLAAMAQEPDLLFITDGPTLIDQLPEADWQRLAAAMQERAIPGFMAAKMQPWYVSMLLSLAPCAFEAMQAGDLGLDGDLMAAAAARDLPVRGLEPYDTVLRVFDALTAGDDLMMVRAALALADRATDMHVTLANAYFDQRAQLIWEFTHDEMMRLPDATPEEAEEMFALMQRVLLTERNRLWIPAILAAAAKGAPLVAFGALHLPGETGVLALLEAEGFTVTHLPY